MVSRALVNQILLGPRLDLRYTQDSPVLPEVWSAFAADPDGEVEVLITPHKESAAGQLAVELAAKLKAHSERAGRPKEPKVAYLESVVAARLSFEELVEVVLPQSEWWRGLAEILPSTDPKNAARLRAYVSKVIRTVLPNPDDDADDVLMVDELNVAGDLARVLTLVGLMGADRSRRDQSRSARRKKGEDRGARQSKSSGRYERMVRSKAEDVEEALNHSSTRKKVVEEASDVICELLGKWPSASEIKKAPGARVWLVSLNRPAFPAISHSVPAIKADAALHLFSVDCSRICWAVLDSGIDATHPAFLDSKKKTRVDGVYDFSSLRAILNVVTPGGRGRRDLIATLKAETGLERAEIEKHLDVIKMDHELGRSVDWSQLEPLLQRGENTPPYSGHGTHVAGILAANWKDRKGRRGEPAPLVGVCPDIRLYDLRVLGESVEETEFAVIGALQFIRYLNDRHGYMAIHGANLSLSIPHDVRNFACGRTPVCEEANRLSANGVVVVAAAGNLGYQSFQVHGGVFEGYSTVSITDPGNADDVITVGATHRFRPLTYGVSFFSSRGPTGDGRNKPDLVAPGEKIEAPVPGGSHAVRDGTSMAAPHVSGAAAMLMARHQELIGQPRLIKQILCKSATDLGRERYFQGAGMLDVLRAMQAV